MLWTYLSYTGCGVRLFGLRNGILNPETAQIFRCANFFKEGLFIAKGGRAPKKSTAFCDFTVTAVFGAHIGSMTASSGHIRAALNLRVAALMAALRPCATLRRPDGPPDFGGWPPDFLTMAARIWSEGRPFGGWAALVAAGRPADQLGDAFERF